MVLSDTFVANKCCVFPKAFRTLFRLDHMLYKKLIFTSTWVLMPTFSQSQVPIIWRSTCMEAFHNTDCMNTCLWGASTLQMSTLLTLLLPTETLTVLSKVLCWLTLCVPHSDLLLSLTFEPQFLSNYIDSLLLFWLKYIFIKYIDHRS